MSSAAAPQRRTHAERTALMRERVMLAVVEVIADVGFARTTAAEIARRAGVTWGAVQHHFGDKDGILMAVLEESFSHFADELGEVAPRIFREPDTNRPLRSFSTFPRRPNCHGSEKCSNNGTTFGPSIFQRATPQNKRLWNSCSTPCRC
jgi:AcrR family transcriptional regulator